jgi:hypothetical protein
MLRRCRPRASSWSGQASACAFFPDVGALSGASSDASVTDAADAATSDSSTDASSDATDSAVATPALVASGNAQGSSASTVIALSPASMTGDLVVVGVVQESGTSAVVTGITDDAQNGSNSYVSANQRSLDSSCANTAEIWYAANVAAKATHVTVTMSAAVNVELWVLEFSGVSALDTGATVNTHAAGTTVAAPPVTPSVASAAIVSTAASCGALGGIANGNAFVPLPLLNGEDAAYFIASQPGSYGATWTSSNGSWNASTAAFR